MSELNTKKKNRRRVIVIIILAIIIAILLTIIIAYPTSNEESGVSQFTSTPESTPIILNSNGEGIDGIYQSMSREEILETLENNQQLVTDKVSSNIIFSSDKAGSLGEFVLENTKKNKLIQQAEIYYGKESILIAKTEPVYPGQYIKSVELLCDIEAGEHEAIVRIKYYDLDSKIFTGEARYTIQMVVNG